MVLRREENDVEDGKSRIEQLILQKKIHSERIKLKEKYRSLFNYHLVDDQLINYEESREIKKRAYERIFKEDNILCGTYQEVLEVSEEIYKRVRDVSDQPVILFYLDGKYGGGVRIRINDVFDCIISKLSDLKVDLLFVSPDLNKGFCIEVEEYNFLITTWGF